MTESTLDTLRKRLDRLERQSRRSKRATLVVIVGATAALLMGQIAPNRPLKTLEAEEFVLRDGRGQIRASLGTTQSPSAAISLRIDGHRLTLEIEDRGRPFHPLDAPSPDLSAPLRERKLGGLGIHFVKQLMDDVAYARVADINRLRLRKRLDANG